jgi:hypothetical protein
MTSVSRREKVSFLRSVGGFNSVQDCFGVFKLPLTVPRALHGSGVDGVWVGSLRGCLARSLLGGDVFPHGAMR